MNTFKIDTLETSQTSGSFRMSPLPDHFGITLGNALRRVLLSAVPGGAVFSIRIDGVFHEFTGIIKDYPFEPDGWAALTL